MNKYIILIKDIIFIEITLLSLSLYQVQCECYFMQYYILFTNKNRAYNDALHVQ